MDIIAYFERMKRLKHKPALTILSIALLTACGSGGGSGDANDEQEPSPSGDKVRAIADLDDYSQFEVSVTTTASSCEPEYVGEAREYDMRINNELGNVTVITATRNGPNDSVLDGTISGTSSFTLNGQISTYAHLVNADDIEVFFQGADSNGAFTHLSANFDWSFRQGDTLCTGSSSIVGAKFDALNYFENSIEIPANGMAQWSLGSEDYTGDAFTYWGAIYNDSQLLQIGSAQVNQAQNESTSVTLAIAEYTGPGTYPINSDEGNSLFIGQYDNGNFNNCWTSPEYNNTSGTVNVVDLGNDISVQFSASMNCYSDLSLETFTHMENSSGSFTIDKE